MSAFVLTGAAYELVGPYSIIFGLGAAAMGGAGLIGVSQAAKHLARFGSQQGMIGLGAVGVLGGVVSVWPVLTSLRWLGIWQAPTWFRQTYPFVLLGVVSLVVYLTLRALVRWAVGWPVQEAWEDVDNE